MRTALTLKNIAYEVYVRLKAAAESHHRSLNIEAIVCLESVHLPGQASAEEVIARAQSIGDSLPNVKFTANDIPVLWRTEFRNLLAGYLRRKQLTFESMRELQRQSSST